MSKIGGFFVPDPISGSYVANKRNEQGSLKYDANMYSVGMQKQAALQDLEKSYEGVINKAYNSYLANQQAIAGTTMGQGYKEMYEEAERQNLIAQQEQAATNVSNVKAQLLGQEQEALQLVQQQGAAEAANLSRVARSMSDYLAYVGSLSNESGGTGYNYLSQLSGKTVTKDTLAEDIYESLFSAQPVDYTDENSNKGMSYSQWLHNQMSNTEEDMAFEQWVFSGGGWLDFQKMAGLAKDTTEEGKKYAEIETARQEKYTKELAEYERKLLIAELDELGKEYGMSGEDILTSAETLNISGQDYIKLSQNSLASGATIDNSKGSTRFAYPGDTFTDKYGNTWEYDAQPQLLAQYGNQPYKDKKISMYAEAVGISANRLKGMSNGDIFKSGNNYYLFQKFESGNFTIRKIIKK